MAPATAAQLSKSASPTRRKPLGRVASGMRLTPTSITTAPGLSMSPVSVFGRPAATTTMSASRVNFAMSGVPVWHNVTVAFVSLRASSTATGLPTMLLRPITTACLPLMSIPANSISLMMPWGVHGRKQRSPMSILPTLTGVKPSTSFSGAIASMTALSRMCFGTGSCTRMPWTAGSALRSFTSLTSASSVVSAGRRISREYMPASAHAFSLAVT